MQFSVRQTKWAVNFVGEHGRPWSAWPACRGPELMRIAYPVTAGQRSLAKCVPAVGDRDKIVTFQ